MCHPLALTSIFSVPPLPSTSIFLPSKFLWLQSNISLSCLSVWNWTMAQFVEKTEDVFNVLIPYVFSCPKLGSEGVQKSCLQTWKESTKELQTLLEGGTTCDFCFLSFFTWPWGYLGCMSFDSHAVVTSWRGMHLMESHSVPQFLGKWFCSWAVGFQTYHFWTVMGILVAYSTYCWHEKKHYLWFNTLSGW